MLCHYHTLVQSVYPTIPVKVRMYRMSNLLDPNINATFQAEVLTVVPQLNDSLAAQNGPVCLAAHHYPPAAAREILRGVLVHQWNQAPQTTLLVVESIYPR